MSLVKGHTNQRETTTMSATQFCGLGTCTCMPAEGNEGCLSNFFTFENISFQGRTQRISHVKADK